LDRVVFKIIPDATARVLALEAGDVDYIPYFGIPLQEVARIQKSGNAEGTFAPGFSSIFMLWFKLRKAPLNAPRVREAIAHAVGRQVILEKASHGVGKLATGPIASATGWAYNPNVLRYPRDVARANRLLDEAGYRRGGDGTRFKLTLVSDAA